MRNYAENPIEPSELMAGKFTELTHVRDRDAYGPYFGDLRVVVDHPRVRALHKTYQSHRLPPATQWIVDGKPVESVDAAAQHLNDNPLPDPPATTKALLAIVFPNWGGEADWLLPPSDITAEHFRIAGEMGLAEIRRRPSVSEVGMLTEARLTDIGRAVLERQYGRQE